MAGNVKFEVSSVSRSDSGFAGSYLSGQRSTYSSPSVDKSTSFREGCDGKGFSSGAAMSKPKDSMVVDSPPLSQCLILEPITMGNSKYTRAGALRRALGVSSFGNVSEDNSLAGAQSRPLRTFSTDEVKRSRATVAEGSMKARSRVKRLDESLNKLNSYCEATISKKQQTNKRSSGSFLLKMGNQSLQSSPELAAQKLEDMNTNIVLNKHGHTPMGDQRAERRSYGVPRELLLLGNVKDAAKEGSSDITEGKVQPLATGGEGWDKRTKRTRSVSSVSRQHVVLRNYKDSAKESSSDIAEGNVQPSPSGGEAWDKRVKRTRSVSSVSPKPLDSDRACKITVRGRPGNNSGIHTSDGLAFRSGFSSGANGSNKIDGSPSTASCIGLTVPKNESEKPSPSREHSVMNKERRLRKGNTKLNMPEEPYLFSPSSITKGKASRAHRKGPRSVTNSFPNISRLSGTPEDREQPLNVNEVQSLAGNRKRPLPTDSSSPPMAQWVGQRPQKISRNRRTNIVSPTSNHDEPQISAEGRTVSGSSSGNTGGMNGSPPARNITSSSEQLKEKLEIAQSPARLSESEGKCAVEKRLMDIVHGAADINDKGVNGDLDANSSGVSTKKRTLPVKDGTGDGIRRQGRSRRCSSFSKGGISPLREKPDSPAVAKPESIPGSEKNGSKSGWPPKKHSDRKGLSCLGPDPTIPMSTSPDLSGESDDDQEEIFAAAQFASSASYNGCSSPFWETLEPFFSARVDEKIFLEEQLKAHGNHLSNSSQMPVMGNKMMNNISQAKIRRTRSSRGGESKSCVLDYGLTDSRKTGDFIIQLHDLDYSFNELDSEKGPNRLTPLYQRLLSALIIEDDLEDYKYNQFLSNSASSANREDPCKAYCYDNARHSRFSSSQVHLYNQIDQGSYCLPHLRGQKDPGYQNEVNRSLAISVDASGICSLECDQMCMDDKILLELQCIGLYTDTMPDLAEGDDELISEDITELKNQHSEQAAKEKAYLERIHKAIEMKDVKGLNLEQVALDRLTELTFRKFLATHANYKVSRNASQAFIERTLARCEEYNAAGKSCFSEPALQDVLLAVPSNNTAAGTSIQAGLLDAGALGTSLVDSNQLHLLSDKSERNPFDAFESITQSDNAFAKNGPTVNHGKKKDVRHDDVGGTASRSTSILESKLPGRAKGKRSERDSSAKNGRASMSNSKGERKTKTKSKPKPKVARLSTNNLQPTGRFSDDLVTNPNSMTEESLISPPGKILGSPSERNDTNHNIDLSSLPLSELDSIDDINVANELDGNQDLSSWLNCDEFEGLQDDDGFGGLQIPMDDLSDLNMIL